ncbi:MAG: glutamate N-acetyltransferase/amino-acid N-acetyltransferase [Halieaceae bacterium]
MAVGRGELPLLAEVQGVRLASGSAGIKVPGRIDTVLFELAESSTIAALFTQNAFCAAPVQVARRHWQQSEGVRYWLVNTGNANAGTGAGGIGDALRCCAAIAELVGVSEREVMPFSTGVIGEPLPADLIVDVLPHLVANLHADGWTDAANGILTTDTRPKGFSVRVGLGENTATVTGIAKGAGMIKPNMATMLAFIATDAAIDHALLQTMLSRAVGRSFNRITVDGDTSTNDACVLVATGAAGNSRIESEDSDLYESLQAAVTTVCLELAQGLIRDGEGAGKYVEIEVSGGQSEVECAQVAYTVAESPLVKTALFAGDPNWGRILAAIGRAGIEALDVSGVTVAIGDTLIAEFGQRAASYTEAAGVAAMAADELLVSINLGRGEHTSRVWTTDLGYEYVRINAEYRS